MRALSVHSGNLYGGVERLLATIIRTRNACPELELEFALCFDGRIAAELRQLGARVSILGATRIRNPLSVQRSRARLAQLLKESDFEVGLCHNAWPQFLFGRVLQAAGVPNVCWVHDLPDGKHWLQRMARRHPPDFAIANSNFTAGNVKLLFGGVPLSVVHPPVAPPEPLRPGERDGIRAELGIAREQVAIVQISRMEPYKGLPVLIEALARLAHDPRWAALIVGGAQRPHEARFIKKMRALARQRGLEQRIAFLGERRDARRLLAAADIFVQANVRPEPFGQVFVEALYAGVPVVTSAMGGPLEIFETGDGVLIQPGDPATLAGALQLLMDDKSIRERSRVTAPQHAAMLSSPEQQVKRLAQVLRMAIEPGKARQAGAGQ